MGDGGGKSIAEVEQQPLILWTYICQHNRLHIQCTKCNVCSDTDSDSENTKKPESKHGKLKASTGAPGAVEANSTVVTVIKSDSEDEREQAKQARRAAAKLDKQLNTAPKRECIVMDTSDDDEQQQQVQVQQLRVLAGKAALAGPRLATSVVVPEQTLSSLGDLEMQWGDYGAVGGALVGAGGWRPHSAADVGVAASKQPRLATSVVVPEQTLSSLADLEMQWGDYGAVGGALVGAGGWRPHSAADAGVAASKQHGDMLPVLPPPEMDVGLYSEGLWPRPSPAKSESKKPKVLSKANFAAYKRSLQDRKKAPAKESKVILQRALKELDDKQAHATQDMLSSHAAHALAALTEAVEAGGSSSGRRRSPRVCKAQKLLYAEDLTALKQSFIKQRVFITESSCGLCKQAANKAQIHHRECENMLLHPGMHGCNCRKKIEGHVHRFYPSFNAIETFANSVVHDEFLLMGPDPIYVAPPGYDAAALQHADLDVPAAALHQLASSAVAVAPLHDMQFAYDAGDEA